ncbi:MAG TPA: hypothetical protein VLK82_25490 [Candidatus Tectomicrobia bacterium]|nr:hypothetical protein [Candidatus Tectomicrobia bacterium]
MSTIVPATLESCSAPNPVRVVAQCLLGHDFDLRYPGALQARTRVRHEDLRATFLCWYPAFDADPRGQGARQAA